MTSALSRDRPVCLFLLSSGRSASDLHTMQRGRVTERPAAFQCYLWWARKSTLGFSIHKPIGYVCRVGRWRWRYNGSMRVIHSTMSSKQILSLINIVFRPWLFDYSFVLTRRWGKTGLAVSGPPVYTPGTPLVLHKAGALSLMFQFPWRAQRIMGSPWPNTAEVPSCTAVICTIFTITWNFPKFKEGSRKCERRAWAGASESKSRHSSYGVKRR